MSSINWNNTSGGNWTDAANWDNGVPTAADDATLGLTGGYSVVLSGGDVAAANSLTISDTSAALALDTNGGSSTTLTVQTDFANSGTLEVDRFFGEGGSNLTLGGTLTNTNTVFVGNTGLSAATQGTAAGLVNTGSIFVQGNPTSGTAVQATLDVTGTVSSALSGRLSVAGDADVALGSAITSIASAGELDLLGAQARVSLGVGTGDTALTGLSSNGGILDLEGGTGSGAGGAALTTRVAFANSGTLEVDRFFGEGGSRLTLGGTLTNTNTVFVGNTGLSAAVQMTAAGLVNTGSIFVQGSPTSGTAVQATLAITGTVSSAISGRLSVAGDADVALGSAITSIASGGELDMLGAQARVSLGIGAGNTALTGLSSNGGVLDLEGGTGSGAGGAALATTPDFANSGTLEVDRFFGEGGSTLTLGGTLTSTNTVFVGNTGLSAAVQMTAAGLVNTGSIFVQGNPTSGTAVQATLDITGAVSSAISGRLSVAGDADVALGSAITSIASAGELDLLGSQVRVSLGIGAGDTALTGLSSNGGVLDLEGGTGSGAGGAVLATTPDFANSGTLELDRFFGEGGSTLALGGTLTNTNTVFVGNTGLSAATQGTAAGLVNTGSIFVQGNPTSGTAIQATLDIIGAVSSAISGRLSVAGDADVALGSAVTSIASAGELDLLGAQAQVSIGVGGGDTALTGLSSNGGVLDLEGGTGSGAGGAALATTVDFANSGTLELDRFFGEGGSTLTLGGTLTNTNTVFVGNTGLSAAVQMTAAGLVNTGSIFVQGNPTSGTAVQATLDITGAVSSAMSGRLSVAGDADVALGSAIASIASGGELDLLGAQARVSLGIGAGNTALTGLSSNGGVLDLEGGTGSGAGGAALATTPDFANSGTLEVDRFFGEGGSTLALGGTLTNTNTVFVGNTGLSAAVQMMAAGLVNAGSIFVVGNTTATQAALDITGAAVNTGNIVLSGTALLSASSLTLQNGGRLTVSAGSTADGVIVGSGGVATVIGGGAIDAPVISGGGLELAGGAAVTGNITIGGFASVLQIDSNNPLPNPIAGMAPGNEIDLRGLTWNPANTVDFTGGLLTVSGGGVTDQLTLSGVADGATFRLVDDQNGGTAVLESIPGGAEWLNTGGGDWNVAGNWSTAAVPGAGDAVLIDRAGTYTVVISNAQAAGTVTLTDADATLQIQNQASLSLFGNVVNRGLILPASGGNDTSLVIAGPIVDLSGGGTIALDWDVHSLIVAGSVGNALDNLDNTISGTGQVGDGTALALINEAGGTIGATASGGLTINTGTTQAVNKGLIEANGSNLTIDSTIANSGTIASIVGTVLLGAGSDIIGGTLAGPSIQVSGNSALDGSASPVLNTASLSVQNQQSLALLGTIVNSGVIAPASGGNDTSLVIASPTVSLSGGGTIALNWDVHSLILAGAAGNVLDNIDNTISGTGEVGDGTALALINEAAGTIAATASGGLTINTGAVSTINRGLIEANGSNLTIDSTVANTGTIASVAGTVLLGFGADIIGGTLTGSSIQVSGPATLDGSGSPVVNTGAISVQNQQSLSLMGAIVNSGVIAPASGGNDTSLVIASPTVALSGGGAIALDWDVHSLIVAGAAGNVLDNIDNTISGTGQIGNGTALAFVNETGGTVAATANSGITINTGAATTVNRGLIESNGNNLTIVSTVANTGTIAAAVATVLLGAGADIIGGTLAGSSIQVSGSATLDGTGSAIVNTGAIAVLNQQSLNLLGAIVNSGVIAPASGGNDTALVIDSPTVTLSGGGGITLNWDVHSLIVASTAGYVLDNIDNTISGTGEIGNGTALAFINESGGTVAATASSGITVNTGAETAVNKGLIESNGNNLTIASTIANAGTIAAVANSVLLAGGADIIGGLLTGPGIVVTGGASLDGSANSVVNSGTIAIQNQQSLALFGAIVNSGQIAPASGGNDTSLVINSPTVSLSGGGTIALNWDVHSLIVAAAAGNVLDNVDNTIDGTGQIGAGGPLALVNEAVGVIAASTSTGITINTGAATTVNKGLLEANGATLTLASAVANQGGTLAAASGNLTIGAGVSVVGYGVLSGPIVNQGVVAASGGLLDITGSLSGGGSEQINNGTLELANGVTVPGIIGFVGAGTLQIDSSVMPSNTISGVGHGDTIDLRALAWNTANTVYFDGTTLTVTGSVTDHLILSNVAPQTRFVVANDGFNGTVVKVVANIFTGTYVNGLVLSDPVVQQPATLTSSALVVIGGSGYNRAVYGENVTGWTVTNYGTVRGQGADSTGIGLAAGGLVVNGAPGVPGSPVTGAFVTGTQNGVAIEGLPGSVINYGTIASTSQGTGVAVHLAHGGRLVNGAPGLPGGIIEAARLAIYIGGNNGVTYAGAAGTVVNYGTMTGSLYDVVALVGGGTVANYGSIVGQGTASGGVYLSPGGFVLNQGVIIGPDRGVYITGGLGTVINEGSIAATNDDAAAVALAAGGSVLNDAAITAYRVGVFGGTAGSPTSVINLGTIAATATGTQGGPASFGVLLLGSGVVGNTGVISAVQPGTGPNTGGVGVALVTGGVVTNGVSGGIPGVLGPSLIAGANYGVLVNGGAAFISNYGTISGATGVSVAGALGGSTIVNEGTITGSGGVAVTFGPGEDVLVEEAGSVLQGAIGAMQAGDVIDLRFLPFVAGGSAVLGANNLLNVVAGGATAGVQLDPAQDFAGVGFQLSDDGLGGSDVRQTVFGVVGPGQTLVVSAGVTLTGVTVLSGGTLDVLSGGAVVTTSVEGGGTEIVEFGGLDVSATLAGVEEVFGLASGTVLLGGGSQVVEAGGVTQAVVLDAAAVQTVSGSASGTVISAGDSQIVASGGVASGTVVSSGGREIVQAGGTTIVPTISGGGFVDVQAGGAASGAITFSGRGGELELDSNAMPAGPLVGFDRGDLIDLRGVSPAGSTVNFDPAGGLLTVSGGGVVDTLVLQGGVTPGTVFLLNDDGQGGSLVEGGPPAPGGLGLQASSDSGALGDGITNVPAPLLLGSGEANDTVTVFDGTVPVGTATVEVNGSWASQLATLAEGPHTLTARETDPAGNVSGLSAGFSLRLDLTPPVAAVTAPLTVLWSSGAVALGIGAPSDASDLTSTLSVLVTGVPGNGAVTLSDGVTAVTPFESLSVAQLVGLEFIPGGSGKIGTTGTLGYTVFDPAGNTGVGNATASVVAAGTASLFSFVFTYADGRDYYSGTVADNGAFGYQVGQTIATGAGQYVIFNAQTLTTEAAGTVSVLNYAHGGAGQASGVPLATAAGQPDGSAGLGSESDAVLGTDGQAHGFSATSQAVFGTIALYGFVYSYANGAAFYSGTVADDGTVSPGSKTVSDGSGQVLGTYTVFADGVTTRSAGTVVVDRYTVGDTSFMPIHATASSVDGTQGLGSELGSIPVNGTVVSFGAAQEPGLAANIVPVPAVPPPPQADIFTAEITAIYSEVLGRSPQAGELASGTSQLSQGVDLAVIRQGLAQSGEAQGNLNQLYQQILDRPGDPAGLANDTAQLTDGASLATVQLLIAQSPEAQADINQIYLDVLGTGVDGFGLTSSMGALSNGSDIDSIRSAVAHSPAADASLSQLFLGTIGRTPDAAELAGMEDQLGAAGSGATRQGLQSALAASGSAGGFTTVTAGPGSAILTPQPNIPTEFVFGNIAFGQDTINGFDPTRDAILISSALAPDPATLQNQTSQTATGTLITLSPSQSITLPGINTNTLNPNDFRIV